MKLRFPTCGFCERQVWPTCKASRRCRCPGLNESLVNYQEKHSIKSARRLPSQSIWRERHKLSKLTNTRFL